MKPKILFVYDMSPEKESMWRDGLWAAVELLKKDFDITKLNLSTNTGLPSIVGAYDFCLGWGGFNSSVDKTIKGLRLHKMISNKFGLCLGGYGFVPSDIDNYNVIFYETEWSKKWIQANADSPHIPNLVHAFGVNADIFNMHNPSKECFWTWTSIGAFSTWKRQEKMLEKQGNRLVIGEIQKDNSSESYSIIHTLLEGGVMISDMVSPEKLADIYKNSNIIYLPATVFGGGERALLEARACGCNTVVESDNPKLEELQKTPIYNYKYYAEQLKKGITQYL